CWRRVVGLALLVVLAGVAGVRRFDASPLVRTVTVGLGPSAVAVDAQSSRVFVANSLSNSVSVLAAPSGTVTPTMAVSTSHAAGGGRRRADGPRLRRQRRHLSASERRRGHRERARRQQGDRRAHRPCWPEPGRSCCGCT